MHVTNITFLILLPLAALLLNVVPRAHRRAYMLGVSYVFYALTSALYLPLLLGVGALAQQIGRSAIAAPSARSRALRAYGAVAVLVLLLIVVRTPTATQLFARSALVVSSGALGRFLASAAPLGFSFYVFEAIGYLVEVAKGREKAYAFFDFQLFVAFFPHLLSGPIMRAKDLIGQFHQPDGLRPREVYRGGTLVIWGLFLKLALSDQLAPRLDAYFDGPAPALSPTDAGVVALGYGIQMYLDFLGYSLIAIGAGLLCGAKLVENFNHPFSAESPADFWNRWHISLSRWIRDYVFLAAVGRSRSLLRLCSAALLAFALCGLWHQWSVKFLVWGLFHGAVLAVYHVYRTLIGTRVARVLAVGPPRASQAYDGLGWLATTAILLPGWVLFRAPTFERARVIFGSFASFERPRAVPSVTVVHVFALYVLVLAAPAAGRALSRLLAWEDGAGAGARLGFRLARGFVFGVIATSILVFWGGHSGFIYLQF
jgi:alginate O-acetyltransferase complex protein AlgI